MIGVGTWATQAEFKDIKVVQGNQVLFASDFSSGLQGWKTKRGKWEVVNGALRQTSSEEDARALFGDPAWGDYTLTLKARKLGGNEGFLILFGIPAPDARVKSWWNLGGWGNKRHAIEAPGVLADAVPGQIETGRWYDLKVELSGNLIRAFLEASSKLPEPFITSSQSFLSGATTSIFRPALTVPVLSKPSRPSLVRGLNQP